MAKKTNIWEAFQFTNDDKSAYDYLNEQKENLTTTTKGRLKLEIEAVDSYLNTEPPKMGLLYKVFLVAPKLGNYRLKLFTVSEFSELGRFPVDIFSHLENEKIENIKEDDFITIISKILFTKEIVKRKIQELYKLSEN